MRRLAGVFLAVFALCILTFGGLISSSTTVTPASQGGAALALMAAASSKEGQGDLTCGGPLPAGAGATVAAAAARAAGFAGEDLRIAVAVAGAESSWNPRALNVNANGSTDHGLWQVNSVHVAILAAGDWTDPYDNAVMARKVFVQAGSSWTPWVTFNTGAYLKHLPAGDAGAPIPDAASCGAMPGEPEGRLTAATAKLKRDAAAAFPGTSIGCYRAAEDGGEHPRGRACDLMVGADKARGDAIARWAQQYPGVKYVIWYQAIWSPGRAREGWRPMGDRGSPTQNHMDHPHVSMECAPGDPAWAGC